MMIALASAPVLIVLIYVGSHGLKDFGLALIGYAVGTVFATAAIVYRDTLWITRPPIWRYCKAAWRQFLSCRNFRRFTLLIPHAASTALTRVLRLKRQLLVHGAFLLTSAKILAGA